MSRTSRPFSLGAAILVVLAVVATPVAAQGVHPGQSHHTAQFAKPLRVGLVTDIGGLNDKGFNHLAYLGLQQAKSIYHIQGQVVESHSQNAYVPNLTHFASQGFDLTIGVGFLMESAIYTVAKQYPKRKFALVDGAPANAAGKTVNLPNVANLFFKEQESGYLVGVMSGLMEKGKVGKATHNVVGAMGGISIPPVNRYIAGYCAGVHQVDPSAKVVVGFSQSFTDQAKSKDIGLTQIGQGADILFAVAGSAGLGYMAAAQQKGLYAIGVDADQGYLGAYVITSAVKRVNVAVRLTVHAVLINRFAGGDHHYSLKNNATGFGKPSSDVPASIVAQTTAYEKKIASGAIVPPAAIPSNCSG